MTTRTLKLLAISFACALATGVTAFGQADSDADTIQVLAKVLNPITVTGEVDLDFGAVLIDSTTTVDPKDTAAGRFAVSATASEQVVLSFTAPTTLGNAEIVFQNGKHSWGTGTQALSTLVGNLDDNTITPGNDAFKVWIGGTLVASSTATAGDYSATFTLTVEYVD